MPSLRERFGKATRVSPSEVLAALTAAPPSVHWLVHGEECEFDLVTGDESALDDAQVGYSRTEDGVSLISGKRGGWRGSWLVVGHESDLFDPLFVDCARRELPVYTAPHGEGSWSPVLLCKSFSAFLAAAND